MNSVRVYRHDDVSVKEYCEVLKFWSNAIGELHSPTEGDISEDRLPAELQRAYNDLYHTPGGASLRYLVETERGYGVALLNEYDRVTSENSGIAFRPLFETVIQDADGIVKDYLFEKAEVFAGELMGFDGCHELVVVFPADVPVEEFCAAADALDEMVYQACGLGKGSTVDGLVEAANEKSVQFVSDSVESVGRFAESDMVQQVIMASDKLRNRTLDVCYGIPGYDKLPHNDKKALYDLVKKAIERSLEAERDVPF